MLTISHLGGCTSDGVGTVPNDPMELVWERYGFYCLSQGCLGNWVKIRHPKQSHGAFRHNTAPVSRSTYKWLVMLNRFNKL